MKRLAVLFTAVTLLMSCAHPQTKLLSLKPGFYAAGDPGCEALWDYVKKANVSMSISRHNGISLPSQKKWNITLDDLRSELRAIKGRRLAEVMLEKNYLDENLHEQVVQILKEEGFEEIVILGAHSGGTFLERHIVNSEQRN